MVISDATAQRFSTTPYFRKARVSGLSAGFIWGRAEEGRAHP